MRLCLAILFVFLLLSCGGEEQPAPADDPAAGNGGSNEAGGEDLSPLKPPSPNDAPPEPASVPEPVDPQAAIFAEAGKLIESSDAEDRAQAIVVLREAEDQTRAGRYVARLLFDRDEEVRMVAAEAIGQFDYPPGADNLRTLLTNEESPHVRKLAIVSLYSMANEAATDDFVAILKNDDAASVRATAAGLLGRIGSEKAVEPLIWAVQNEFDDSVLLQALVALRKIGAREAVDTTIEALEYSSVLVRTEAARALGELGEKKAIGPLVVALNPTEDSQVLSAAVSSLVRLTGVTKAEMQLDDESTIEEQEAAIAAWKKWWEDNGGGSGD